MAPRYETNVTAVQYVERSQEKDRVIASLRGGYDEEMDVRIVRGWCLMQSQSFVIAFGARPEGSRTLLSHLEHSRTGAQSTLTAQQLHRAQEKLARELDAIEALRGGVPVMSGPATQKSAAFDQNRTSGFSGSRRRPRSGSRWLFHRCWYRQCVLSIIDLHVFPWCQRSFANRRQRSNSIPRAHGFSTLVLDLQADRRGLSYALLCPRRPGQRSSLCAS